MYVGFWLICPWRTDSTKLKTRKSMIEPRKIIATTQRKLNRFLGKPKCYLSLCHILGYISAVKGLYDRWYCKLWDRNYLRQASILGPNDQRYLIFFVILCWSYANLVKIVNKNSAYGLEGYWLMLTISSLCHDPVSNSSKCTKPLTSLIDLTSVICLQKLVYCIFWVRTFKCFISSNIVVKRAINWQATNNIAT